MPEGIQPELRFGPKEIVGVRLSDIVALPQMRQVYDEEALKELEDSLLAESWDPESSRQLTSDDVNLNNAINLARLSRPQAETYIAENADYYGTAPEDQLNLDELSWDEHGKTHILIAGHRRTLAMNRVAERFGFSPDDVFAASTVYDGITFNDALPLQTRENIYKAPPAVDEARQVDLRYRYLARHGRKPPVRELASFFGYSETKVRDALAFASLPPLIQSFATDKLLPFTTVKQLEPLARAYRKYYSATGSEAIEQTVESELVIACNRMLSMTLSGNTDTKRATFIDNLRREIEDQADTFQPELFFIETESVEQRVTKSTRTLRHDVGAVAMYLARQGELGSDDISALEEVLRVARSRQAIELEFTTATGL